MWHKTSPTAVAGWAWSAALGLLRIAEGNADGASENIKILLTHLLARPWLRPDTLSFVTLGIRAATAEFPETADPLRPVLARTFSLIADKHGAPKAAEFVLMLVANPHEEDRVAAVEVILTTGN